MTPVRVLWRTLGTGLVSIFHLPERNVAGILASKSRVASESEVQSTKNQKFAVLIAALVSVRVADVEVSRAGAGASGSEDCSSRVCDGIHVHYGGVVNVDGYLLDCGVFWCLSGG